MTGTMFVGSRSDLLNERIKIEKVCWGTTLTYFGSNAAAYYYLIDQNKEIHYLNDDELFVQKWYLRPLINLKDVPEDYKIGDYFTLPNLKPTWEYVGKDLGISTEYYGPLKLDELEDKFEELKNDR